MNSASDHSYKPVIYPVPPAPKPADLEFRVIRDQGYGRVHARSYPSLNEAKVAMAEWQRHGFGTAHPSLIGGGCWRIDEMRHGEVSQFAVVGDMPAREF